MQIFNAEIELNIGKCNERLTKPNGRRKEIGVDLRMQNFQIGEIGSRIRMWCSFLSLCVNRGNEQQWPPYVSAGNVIVRPWGYN